MENVKKVLMSFLERFFRSLFIGLMLELNS